MNLTPEGVRFFIGILFNLLDKIFKEREKFLEYLLNKNR